MRILLVGSYPPPFGGISVHVQTLHHLLIKEGIDCKALNVNPQTRPSRDYINVSNYGNFLTRLISAGRGRIVHVHTNGHNPKSWAVAAASGWVGRLFGQASIFTIHSGMAPDYIEHSSLWKRLLIKLALAPQSYVICVNEQIRAALASIGYISDKTLVMPAFLFDSDEMSPLDDDLQNRLSQFDPLLSAVASFRPEYGLELLIEAIGKLKNRFPRIGCAVMSSGDVKEHLLQLASDHGVNDRLLWLGGRSHGECLSVINYSDLFVRPTLADGDAVSVREALELKIPVVASDVGHRPQQALLFQCGNADDFAEKCSSALASPKTARRQEPSLKSGILLQLIDIYNRILRPQTGVGRMRSAK